MENKFWYDKAAELIFLLSIGSLGFIFKYLWNKSIKAYTLSNDKDWMDRFEREMVTYIKKIELLERDVRLLKEDKRIKEAISKALEDKQYKNGL